MVSGHLSKELRAKYKKRTFGLHRGDTVVIKKGNFRKKSGKIESVLTKLNKIYVEGISISKPAGTKAKVPIPASSVIITELNLDDKWRKKLLEGGKKETGNKEATKK